MAVPKWDDSYAIGLPSFDSDHKLITGKVETIAKACESGEDGAVVVGLLDDLLDFFLRHIAWEERWMDRLSTPAGHDHKHRHKSGHRELAARAMLLREKISIGGDVRAALEDLGFFLTLFELIEFDFELVGLLRREGILSAQNPELLEKGLPDPGQVAAAMGPAHSPILLPEPAEEPGQSSEIA